MGFGINQFVGDGYTKDPTGSTNYQLFTSTGLQYSNGVPSNYYEDGSTASNLKAYGVSLLTASTLDQKVYTIDNPIKGIRKTLALYSTGITNPLGSSMLTIVKTPSTATYFIDNSTAFDSDKHYLAFDRPYTAVEMLGLSTSKWGILSMIMASSIATAASTGTGVIVSLGSSNSSGLATT